MGSPGISGGSRRVSEPERDLQEIDRIRALLLQAGIERDEEELARLLPWYRLHHESGARISGLALGDVEPPVVFDPRWRS